MEETEEKAETEVNYDLPEPNISSIKNKQRRQELYRKMKREKRKIKVKERKKKRKEREALGDKAPPKQVPKTIENCRVRDETMVDPQDEEVMQDEAVDDVASYFHREKPPKILITTSVNRTLRTHRFCRELKRVLPNASVFYRRNFDLKKLMKQATDRDFTVVLVINEDHKKPNGLLVSHLPDGPTAHFKISNVRFKKEIKRCGESTPHLPEVILNNFTTRLGHSVGRLLASMFPHEPEFFGRRVITLHNQRDFIFFRHHRYKFKDAKRCGLQELGPRFTLKLRSLQKGTFDSKFGEYEWVHKRHEMETSRRKFFL